MRSDRGLDRLVNFSDAVVAIAATLLVLPLVDTASTIGSQHVGTLLAHNWRQIFSFVLSFAVICRFWVVHHGMYEYVQTYSSRLVWMNCFWLLTIVFLPFPTQLVGSAAHDERALSAIYIGTFVLATAASVGEHWVILRSPELYLKPADAVTAADGRTTPDEGMSMVPAVVALALMTLALVIAVSVPSVGELALLVLLASGRVEALVRRRQAA